MSHKYDLNVKNLLIVSPLANNLRIERYDSGRKYYRVVNDDYHVVVMRSFLIALTAQRKHGDYTHYQDTITSVYMKGYNALADRYIGGRWDEIEAKDLTKYRAAKEIHSLIDAGYWDLMTDTSRGWWRVKYLVRTNLRSPFDPDNRSDNAVPDADLLWLSQFPF